MAELSAAKSPSTPSAAVSEPRRAVAIWDGHGGMLTLDFACGDLHVQVDAWRSLPAGGLEVSVGELHHGHRGQRGICPEPSPAQVLSHSSSARTMADAPGV